MVGAWLTRRGYESWRSTVKLERLVTGKRVAQLIGCTMNHRRKHLLRLAKQRGIDVSSVLNAEPKRSKPMPPSIDKPDRFI